MRGEGICWLTSGTCQLLVRGMGRDKDLLIEIWGVCYNFNNYVRASWGRRFVVARLDRDVSEYHKSFHKENYGSSLGPLGQHNLVYLGFGKRYRRIFAMNRTPWLDTSQLTCFQARFPPSDVHDVDATITSWCRGQLPSELFGEVWLWHKWLIESFLYLSTPLSIMSFPS